MKSAPRPSPHLLLQEPSLPVSEMLVQAEVVPGSSGERLAGARKHSVLGHERSLGQARDTRVPPDCPGWVRRQAGRTTGSPGFREVTGRQQSLQAQRPQSHNQASRTRAM